MGFLRRYTPAGRVLASDELFNKDHRFDRSLSLTALAIFLASLLILNSALLDEVDITPVLPLCPFAINVRRRIRHCGPECYLC